jgi:hypothetical protein
MSYDKVRIVDLDSTVSDDRWRQWLIDPSQPDSNDKYHAYHIHCDQDPVINRHLVDESPVPVVFVTARPEYTRQKTCEWLREHNLRYIALVMRPDDDNSPSPVLKQRALLELERIFEIESAYDDREDVIEMFLHHNIKAILV